MLRIGIGAPHGLRLGVCGFAAALLAFLAFSSGPTQAAPYADIVVDANSGKVLHETSPDARRHPASLTKIMTLYLLFEQLEAGKLKLDSQLKISKEAAEQMPTKLGLKPGSTLAVEDAIKGMVTRSANDAAVVVAEAIAGDEDEFAKLMTRKAQALGMSRTVYKNASGLPNDDQVTTARDQALLGRAIQERFPRYYKYFSTRSFTFRGQSIGNHNHLLGRVEGVDGIKTGYTGASGFNLVTSVHRGNRYLVAVVLGGSSAGSRDSRMRELISDNIKLAATKRTASMIAEASTGAGKAESRANESQVREEKPQPEPKRVAKVEPRSKAKPEPKPEPKAEARIEERAEPRFAIASAFSAPATLDRPVTEEPVAAPPETPVASPSPQVNVGSTEPIRPVPVKTLAVRAGGAKPSTSTPAPLQAAPTAQPGDPARGTPVPVSELPPAVPGMKTQSPRVAAIGSASAAAAQLQTVSAPTPLPDTAAQKSHARNGWMIQVGAYHAEQEAKQRLSAVQSKAAKMLSGADPVTETFDRGGTTYYRARFAGPDKDKAEAACKYLKRNDVECVTIKD